MGSAAYAASGVWAIAQSVATSLLSRLSSVARRAFSRLSSNFTGSPPALRLVEDDTTHIPLPTSYRLPSTSYYLLIHLKHFRGDFLGLGHRFHVPPKAAVVLGVIKLMRKA